MSLRYWLLSGSILSGVTGGVLLAAGPLMAADVALKAPGAPATLPAVSGPNGKWELLGGSLGGEPLAGIKGSYSVPVGPQHGVQVDVAVGTLDGYKFGMISGHAFSRNPAQGLAGVYANYTYSDQFDGVHIGQVAVEGEHYAGRFTLQGILGVEFGDSESEFTGFFPGGGRKYKTVDIRTRFFDQINLAYYPTDNAKVFIGHRYVGGRHALALGGELAATAGRGHMASLFAEGRIGEDDYRGIWGGVKFYFGPAEKSLIRRHREDDPLDWNPETLFTLVNSFGLEHTCPPNEVFVNGQCVGLSDIRLKRDVAHVATLDNGIRLYRYRYLSSETAYVGVMAQQVAEIAPEAVIRGTDGYFRVNYTRLGLRLLTWDEWVASSPAGTALAA